MSARKRSEFVSRGDGDRGFKIFFGAAIAWTIICCLASLALLGFVIWALIQVMDHFGVIG